MCIIEPCADPTSPGIWWRDDTEWKPYAAAMVAAIQRGLANRANLVELGNLASSKYARGARYVVDLASMKQINVATGFSRDVRVVRAPAAQAAQADELASVKAEVRACQEGIKSLTEMVKKLEADLVVMKSQALKNEANRVPAKGLGTILHQRDHWESCDSAEEYCPDYVSDDDY